MQNDKDEIDMIGDRDRQNFPVLVKHRGQRPEFVGALLRRVGLRFGSGPKQESNPTKRT